MIFPSTAHSNLPFISLARSQMFLMILSRVYGHPQGVYENNTFLPNVVIPLPLTHHHTQQKRNPLSFAPFFPISTDFLFICVQSHITTRKGLISNKFITIFGAFAKFRKAHISFAISVRLSVRMEKLGSH
jgi:hypothetical protein